MCECARLRIELVEFEKRVKELQVSLHNIEWEVHSNNCQSPLHREDRLVTRIEEVLARIAGAGSDSWRDRMRYAREGEVAKYIGVSVSTLRSWRTKRSKNGPPYTRLGRLVMYPIAELDEHMKA
jgi:predicted DNA-binding transcriptional regulator AlpA